MRTSTVATVIVVLACIAAWAPSRAADRTRVGQIACSACWHEADRATVPYGGSADQACAARCAADGIPPALAERAPDGTFTLSVVRGAPPPPFESWLELIGSFVRAETESADGGAIRVLALDVLDASPWPPVAGDAPERSALAWPDLTGNEQSLASFRGRVTVVNFWATWCKPCVEEMPVLSGIQNDYAPLGVQVVGIAADAPDRARAVLAFARELGVNFPVWLGATTTDMTAFGVGPALPATVVLDPDGGVVHRVAGVVEDDDLRAVLDEVLRTGAGSVAAGPEAPDRDRGAGATDVADAGHRHDPGHRARPGEASLVPS